MGPDKTAFRSAGTKKGLLITVLPPVMSSISFSHINKNTYSTPPLYGPLHSHHFGKKNLQVSTGVPDKGSVWVKMVSTEDMGRIKPAAHAPPPCTHTHTHFIFQVLRQKAVSDP